MKFVRRFLADQGGDFLWEAREDSLAYGSNSRQVVFANEVCVYNVAKDLNDLRHSAVVAGVAEEAAKELLVGHKLEEDSMARAGLDFVCPEGEECDPIGEDLEVVEASALGLHDLSD